MQKFKIGDKVLCIDARGEWCKLVEGGIYTIKGFEPHRNELLLEGVPLSWMMRRFELYESAQVETEQNQQITVESAITFLTSQGYTVSLSKV